MTFHLGDHVHIRLASPNTIKQWGLRIFVQGGSVGEVYNAETINYRTLKPEVGGLFCEQIFGPVKNWQCSCGYLRYQRPPRIDLWCPKCFVQITRNITRRRRMGYIPLAAPVLHIWFTKSFRALNPISRLLFLLPKQLPDLVQARVWVPAEFCVVTCCTLSGSLYSWDSQAMIEAQLGSAYPTSVGRDLGNLVQRTYSLGTALWVRNRVHNWRSSFVEAQIAKPQSEQLSSNSLGVNLSVLGSYSQLYDNISCASILGSPVISLLKVRKTMRLFAVSWAYTFGFCIPSSDWRFGSNTSSLDGGSVLIPPDLSGKKVNANDQFALWNRTQIDFEQASVLSNTCSFALSTLLQRLNLVQLRGWLSYFLSIVNNEKLHQMKPRKCGKVKMELRRTQTLILRFLRHGMQPSWICMYALPVLPPELRPIIQVGGGHFVTSDINDLYRRVLYRNTRLNKFLGFDGSRVSPDTIVFHELILVQQSVDALLDNARLPFSVSRSPMYGTFEPLKSLSDRILGKYGRFRQNLLGKRVDYSGRSVIIVGPTLKLFQCGIPYELACELFQPFLIRMILHFASQQGVNNTFRENNVGQNFGLETGLLDGSRPRPFLVHQNIKTVQGAKLFLHAFPATTVKLLQFLFRSLPVVLNRAPTLHRLGMQAFFPVLVAGRAIQLHPFVCPAFNADFDGDQMAIHVPLRLQAAVEAKLLLLSPHTWLSPSTGQPSLMPSQDIVLGFYYTTLAVKPTSVVPWLSSVRTQHSDLSVGLDTIVSSFAYSGPNIIEFADTTVHTGSLVPACIGGSKTSCTNHLPFHTCICVPIAKFGDHNYTAFANYPLATNLDETHTLFMFVNGNCTFFQSYSLEYQDPWGMSKQLFLLTTFGKALFHSWFHTLL